jgi:hypothetical protein
VHRFDLLRNTADPANFALVEVYNSPIAAAEHKATAHYAQWAEAVKGIMARPRTSAKYATKFPAPLYWHRSAYLTHPGEAAEVEAEGEVEGKEEGGLRGLSAVSGSAFGFLSPKVLQTITRIIAGPFISLLQ